MRRIPPTRYIPDGAVLVDGQGTDAVVYTYESRGKAYAIGYHGKAQRPDFHHSYASPERRAEHVAGFIAGRRSRAAAKAEWQAKARAPHSLQVGAVLVSSWGYEQTNVDWYEVTRIVGARTVEIRKIMASSRATGYMQAKESPRPGEFCGEAMTRRASASGSVKVDDCRSASLWDGRERYSSSYY